MIEPVERDDRSFIEWRDDLCARMRDLAEVNEKRGVVEKRYARRAQALRKLAMLLALEN